MLEHGHEYWHWHYARQKSVPIRHPVLPAAPTQCSSRTNTEDQSPAGERGRQAQENGEVGNYAADGRRTVVLSTQLGGIIGQIPAAPVSLGVADILENSAVGD